MTGDRTSDVDLILSDRFLGRALPCSCGRAHRILTQTVVIEAGVAARVPEMLSGLGGGPRVLLVADRRTWEVAGVAVAAALEATHTVSRCVLEDDADGQVHASVELVDELERAFDDRFDCYLAVGSGTVNDLTKELAFRRRRPYAVLATAASMNGYTSAIVALLDGGLKTTRETAPPVAVFADPAILVQAPRELTLAGLGDLVSKPYCGCDWLIASLVRGEYHCPLPDRLLAGPFESALGAFSGLAEDDPEVVALLFKLLLVSGISMAVTGTSSPASGGEHLLSHYWDMTRLRDGRPLNLHGAQVGVASLIVDELYACLLEVDFGTPVYRPGPSLEEAERRTHEVFGSLAGAVWPQWRAKLEARGEADLQGLRAHQGDIRRAIAHTLEVGRGVRRALSGAGAPLRAAQLGIDDRELVAAVRHGRTIRPRFTVLDVAAELGVLEDFADGLGGRS